MQPDAIVVRGACEHNLGIRGTVSRTPAVIPANPFANSPPWMREEEREERREAGALVAAAGGHADPAHPGGG
jgi:hypothetical protein